MGGGPPPPPPPLPLDSVEPAPTEPWSATGVFLGLPRFLDVPSPAGGEENAADDEDPELVVLLLLSWLPSCASTIPEKRWLREATRVRVALPPAGADCLLGPMLAAVRARSGGAWVRRVSRREIAAALRTGSRLAGADKVLVMSGGGRGGGEERPLAAGMTMPGVEGLGSMLSRGAAGRFAPLPLPPLALARGDSSNTAPPPLALPRGDTSNPFAVVALGEGMAVAEGVREGAPPPLASVVVVVVVVGGGGRVIRLPVVVLLPAGRWGFAAMELFSLGCALKSLRLIAAVQTMPLAARSREIFRRRFWPAPVLVLPLLMLPPVFGAWGGVSSSSSVTPPSSVSVESLAGLMERDSSLSLV